MSGRVLIADDVTSNRIIMKAKLTAAGYLPVVVADGAACLDRARSEPPDVVLLSLNLPDLAGTEVLRRLRSEPATRSVPVVMFAANAALDDRLDAFRLGADDVFLGPLDDQTLLARLRSLMRARESVAALEAGLGEVTVNALAAQGLAEGAAPFRPAASVALVMHRPETAMALRRGLTGKLSANLLPMTADQALANGLQDGPAPDIFVIEADLPIQGGGLRLMSDLRSRASTRNARFMIFRGPDSAVAPTMAFDLGASDLVSAETAAMELALRLQRLLTLKHGADQLRASVQDGLRLAMIDPLTGLHNRRYGLAQLQAIAEKARATGSAFAVLVADIDRFKTINDRFGHAAGDAVLVEVAARLRKNLRAGDLLARIGGEEFLIALPDVALAEARQIADRLCDVMLEGPFKLARAEDLPVTISIGLAISETGETPAPVETVGDIFNRADRALMRSKAAGRNQVTVCRRAA